MNTEDISTETTRLCIFVSRLKEDLGEYTALLMAHYIANILETIREKRSAGTVTPDDFYMAGRDVEMFAKGLLSPSRVENAQKDVGW